MPDARTDIHALTAIAARHGLAPPARLPVPWTGAASHVYPVGDVVIKIPFDRPDTIEAVTTDAAVTPFVRALGVQAAELIAFDDSLDIIPVPFAILRRVEDAVPLDRSGRSDRARAIWHEVGRQLARVHAVAEPSAVPIDLRTFRQTPDVDPRPWTDELREAGLLSPTDARLLRDLLDRLAPSALAEESLALCHGDVNAANILVDEGTQQLRALIDWGSSGWHDPVWDFARVSLDGVPFLLAGHRSIAPLPNDDTAEARICWCQAQVRLHSIRNLAGSDDVRGQVRSHVERLRHFVRATGLM